MQNKAIVCLEPQSYYFVLNFIIIMQLIHYFLIILISEFVIQLTCVRKRWAKFEAKFDGDECRCINNATSGMFHNGAEVFLTSYILFFHILARIDQDIFKYNLNSKSEIRNFYMSFQNCFGPIVFLAKPQTSSAYNFNIHYKYIHVFSMHASL